jgi:adenosine deaminase
MVETARPRAFIFWAVLLVFVPLASAQQAAARREATPEARASRYFESVSNQPLLLGAFLSEMPKGADLHNHLSGSIYAESYLAWAAEDGLCIDRKQMSLVSAPCDDIKPPASLALQDADLYRQLLDSLSMRDYHDGPESGHDHFFAAFGKFNAATRKRLGDMLAEIASRAADESVLYLELMTSPIGGTALGQKLGWDDDFGRMRQKLLEGGMSDVVSSVRKAIDTAEARRREVLHCGSPQAQPGCDVQLRFLYQGLRAVPREQAFAQLLAGFEVVSADPRYVGINLVQAEDGYVSMRDFDLQMRMVGYLHQQYPKVHIALHAGELAPGMVTPEGLRNHIRDSVERGHAERIGHGADVMYERDPIGLLKELARRKVLVEICLTSNDMILGMHGPQHPLPVYLKYGVPVALATDDAGVARSDISREYQRAVESYSLHYPEIKRMARLSVEHGFLPGQSMWADFDGKRMNAACQTDLRGKARLSKACESFLTANEKARMQWKLEQQFAAFEARY